MYQVIPAGQPPAKPLPQKLQHEIDLIKSCTASLVRIDQVTQMILKPLNTYRTLSIGHLQDTSMSIDEAQSNVTFNQDFLKKIVHNTSKAGLPQEDINLALIIFILHELTHISQRVRSFAIVQRIKQIGLSEGREQMAKWDLEADWLAAHILSLFKTKTENGEYNEQIYIAYLYYYWCKVCRAMLVKRASSSRTDKLQRTFGYLLMSALIKEAYLENRPRPFNSELFPKWNLNLNYLMIQSGGYLFYAGNSVSSLLMKQVLNHIKECEYNEAEAKIFYIWQHLPKR